MTVVQVICYIAIMIATGCGSSSNPANSNNAQPFDSLKKEDINTKQSAFYLSNLGDDNNSCEEAAPCKTLSYALSLADAGSKIYLRAGIYPLGVTIAKSGEENNPIMISAYHDESVTFLGTTKPTEDFVVSGSWLVIKDIEISHAFNGLMLREDASYNVIENVDSHHNHFSGFMIDGNASYNTLKNCDAHHNYDALENYPLAYRPEVPGGNADGFGAGDRGRKGLAFAGGVGNVLVGCRAFLNSDDGFDFFRLAHSIKVENCLAYKNGVGYMYGDGNGFKLGLHHPEAPALAKHVVTNCIAWGNKSRGFDYNDNESEITLQDNTAYNNRVNYKFSDGRHVLKNNISIYPTNITEEKYYNDSYALENSWGVIAADAPSLKEAFMDFNDSVIAGARAKDGSIQYGDFLKPKENSALTNMGFTHNQN